jgi:hypothetical protein
MSLKKNVDLLPKHGPYDYFIDLEEGTWPPFGPIYNLSQNELTTFLKYIDETLTRDLFDIPSL